MLGSAIRFARKLRGRTVRELRVRAGQAALARLEEIGGASDARLPTDGEFRRRLTTTLPPEATACGESFGRYLATRQVPFFAGALDAEATAALVADRWPAERLATIAAADRLRAGRFDLLGYRDLSFGDPIDWWLDPLAGRRAPDLPWRRVAYLSPDVVGDHKLVWELNRLQHLVTLARAYAATGDERYARCVADRLTAWMDANPPKRGVNWASSLEVGYRAIAWLWALTLCRRSPSLAPELVWRAWKYLAIHGRHLERYLSTYFSPNTHLTGEALALYYLGVSLPELRRAARWRAVGWRTLIAELDRQVRPDGVYFEQTTYYHRYTVDIYTHALVLGRAAGERIPERLEKALLSLLDHLRDVTRPDGHIPLIGDDDGGRLLPLDERPGDDVRAPLAVGAALFGRSDYAYVARGACGEVAWLLGEEGLRRLDDLGEHEPTHASRGYAAGGVFVMRDGWGRDASVAVIDCGPHGAGSCGHAHADALSFDLTVRGRPLLVDPGTYTYTVSAAERDDFRTTAAHNTVTLDGQSSSRASGPFSWHSRVDGAMERWIAHRRADLFVGRHDGFEPGGHERTMLALKGDYWVLVDRVTASAGQHACTAHFHAAPGSALYGDGALRAWLRSDDGAVRMLLSFGGDADEVECAQGWVSRAYGARERAPVCRVTARGTERMEIVTALVPAAPGARVECGEVAARGGRALRIAREGAWTDHVLLRTADWITCGEWATDARCAVIRAASNGGHGELLLLDVTGFDAPGLRIRTDARRECVELRCTNDGWHAVQGDGVRIEPEAAGGRRPGADAITRVD